MLLKYLFHAQFADGSFIAQTPEDVSRILPEKSCFYDVLQLEKDGKKLETFQLRGEGHTYIVDLRDGHFEVDGREVWIGGQMPPANIAPLRLVFYRQHAHQFNVGMEELAHTVRYCLGWQCTIPGENGGQNIQQIMGVF